MKQDTSRRWAKSLSLVCACVLTSGLAQLMAQGDHDYGWVRRADIPLHRHEAAGLAVSGELFVFGGYVADLLSVVRADAYDPATNTWRQLANVPEPLTHSAQAADGKTVYLVGGLVGDAPGPSTDEVWCYDIPTDRWATGTSLPTERASGTLVRIGRALHYFGGGVRPPGTGLIIDQPTHYVLQLGPTSSPNDDAVAWTSAAPMPNPRNHIGGIAVGGLGYAIGGQHGLDEFVGNQNSVDCYDPATDTWTARAPLPIPLGHVPGSIVELDGRIIVVGGVSSASEELASIFEYYPQFDIWSELPGLPKPRGSSIAGVIDGNIIVSTGLDSEVSSTTWVTTGLSTVPRVHLAARWSFVGAGCGPLVIGSPTLVCVGGPPTLGTPDFAVAAFLAPPLVQASLFIATGIAPTPIDLGGGCFSYLDPASFISFTLAGVSPVPVIGNSIGIALLPLPIPDLAALSGASIALQALVPDPLAANGFDTSNALLIEIR